MMSSFGKLQQSLIQKEEEETILPPSFGISDDQLAQLRKIKAEQEVTENAKPKKKNSAKKPSQTGNSP